MLFSLLLLQTTDKLERDRLIHFLNALIKNKVPVSFVIVLVAPFSAVLCDLPSCDSSSKDSPTKNHLGFCKLFANCKNNFELSLFIYNCGKMYHFMFSFLVLQRNVKEMMDVNGIRVLVDLLTLAHLHTSRAVVPLQVICSVERMVSLLCRVLCQ